MQGSFNINLVMLVVVGIVMLIMLFSMVSTIAIWFQSLASGAPIPLLNIVFMRFRKVPPKLIVETKIMLVKAGLDIDTDKLEAHYLAGGNVIKVAQALIGSHKAGKGLTFEQAAAVDLAGRDVLKEVQDDFSSQQLRIGPIPVSTKDRYPAQISFDITLLDKALETTDFEMQQTEFVEDFRKVIEPFIGKYYRSELKALHRG